LVTSGAGVGPRGCTVGAEEPKCPPASSRFPPVARGATISAAKVDRASPTPLHEQVAALIRRAIADGEANPGERLPLAKDLAAVLGVNKNTVLRALHLLRDEGLLDFGRGRGITVAGTRHRGAVLTQARKLVVLARKHGYQRSELIQMIIDLTPGT